MAKASSSNGLLDFCITCSSKYNRVRSSLCYCKHCDQSFCFDCMKDHNDELQQNIAQVTNRYNELKDLLHKNGKMITDETIKSKKQMSEWLTKYIANLTAEKARIDEDIDKAEIEAQKFVHDIEGRLQTFSGDIETFTKNSTFQSVQMAKLLKQLDELIQWSSSLTTIREYELSSTMPQYKFKFKYSPKSTADDIQKILKTSERQDHEESKTTELSQVENYKWSVSFVSNTKNSWDESNNAFYPDENYFSNRDRYEATSYNIDCMASDGINIMYSTIEHPEHDIIAYCYLNVRDVNYRQGDPYRPWFLSRIVDMIWWNSIGKFVCATENGILTVEYLNKHFKILTVIHDRWTDVRVAVNTKNIWVHVMGKIMIYNINFMLVRSINFDIPCIITRESFCVTDNIVTFLVIRGDRTRCDILQAQFYDTNMIKIKAFDVGLGKAPCMVRTDGADCFFIAGGKELFYIMSCKGPKGAINLGKEASCLAVVNSRNIALTKERSEIELLKY